MQYQFQVFSYGGTQYRAKLKAGQLVTLCSRRGGLYPWRVISGKKHKPGCLIYICTCEKGKNRERANPS